MYVSVHVHKILNFISKDMIGFIFKRLYTYIYIYIYIYIYREREREKYIYRER